MAEFVGLVVKVELVNGQSVDGTIEGVSATANLLLLANAGTSPLQCPSSI